MNSKNSSGKSGIGVGSASIVLIFSVLCLTVFTLITYISASNHKALTDAETQLVTGYYRADAMAVNIIHSLLAGDAAGLPGDIEINTLYDGQTGEQTVYFNCPVNDIKSLYVRIILEEDAYRVLDWQMVDLEGWNPDGGINVWDGF